VDLFGSSGAGDDPISSSCAQITTCPPWRRRGTFRSVPKDRHPLERAVWSSWCKQNGLDEAQLARWIAGTEQVPRQVAEELRRVLGVPVASWKIVEPTFRLRSRRKGGTFDSMESSEFHVENDSAKAHPFRRGQKLVSQGPIALGVRNAGLKSRADLARALGFKVNSVKTWDRRGTAPQDVKEALSKPPYSVPLSAWK
jgi:hypothetical protein